MIPIIFMHYGNAPYLRQTMRAASITNPQSRRILLGDSTNAKTAKSCEWEHFLFDGFTSEKHREFLSVYKRISGRSHGKHKSGRDWVKFVFERWFFVEQFCLKNSINEFYSFDSDTIIATDLSAFVPYFSQFDCTCQCNGICLNGYVKIKTLSAYTRHIINLFKDEAFLAGLQHEFDTINPGYAFTEMRAFENFRLRSGSSAMPHLENMISGWWFDDCLMQDDDFITDRVPFTKSAVKRVTYSDGVFYGHHKTLGRVSFATLNMSWLPPRCISWALQKLEGAHTPREETMAGDRRLYISQAGTHLLRNISSVRKRFR